MSYLLVLLLVSTLPDSLTGRSAGWHESLQIVDINGQITLEDLWLIPGTAEIIGITSPIPLVVIWNDSLNTFRATPPNSQPGDTLLIRWRRALISDRPEYYYYQPHISPTDTSTGLVPILANNRTESPLGVWRGMRRSGSIVRGIRFGSEGQTGSASGLHLELSGRPSPGVEIEAIIDDRAISSTSGGGSSTLQELDKLLIRASTEHLEGSLGDLSVNWGHGRYNRFERRVKGAEAIVHSRRARLAGLAGGGENRYARVLLAGRGGDQGPYEVRDRYGSIGVTLVSGTEKLWLDGRLLKRGRDADYQINYERGTIQFNPTVLIQEGSRIEIEYEYADDAYPKALYGVNSAVTNGKENSFRIEATALEEGRDGERPLGFEWTPESRAAAEVAGDAPDGGAIPSIRDVGAGNGDYVWSISIDGDSILVFSFPDSLGKPTGALQAEFSRVPGGDYDRVYDQSLQLFYYRYAGRGIGGYAPERRLPLPDRARLGVIRADWSRGGFRSNLETAASDYDANRLSSLDDGDNTGMAVNWTGDWKSPDEGIGTDLRVRHEQVSFHPFSAPEEPDHLYRWGINSTTLKGSETVVEGGLDVRPLAGLFMRGEAGRLMRKGVFESNRGGVRGTFDAGQTKGDANFSRVQTKDLYKASRGLANRFTSSVERDEGITRPRLRLRIERDRQTVADTLQDGTGIYEGEPGLGLHLKEWANFDLDYTYRYEEKVGGGDFQLNSESRSLQFGWNGKTSESSWQATALRSLVTFGDPLREPVVSTSAALSGNAGSYGSPLRLTGDYRLMTGNSRSEAWVATYVGVGRGSFRREGDRYVPDPDGDFELVSLPTDTIRFSSRVEFDGRLEWRPGRSSVGAYPAGISGTITRFEAEVVTTEPDPRRAFLLDRAAFRSPLVRQSRWNWRQEVNFLDSKDPGDGKLTLLREESRDAGLAGGEENLTEAFLFLARMRHGDGFSTSLEPMLERRTRRGLAGGALRSKVSATGVDVEGRKSARGEAWTVTLRTGREVRRDAVTGIKADETRLMPTVLFRLREASSLRLEGEWRGLSASSPRAGYDLLRGWSIGDNYSSGIGVEYRLGRNLSSSASFRSRWRAGRPPIHSGLIEMTATL